MWKPIGLCLVASAVAACGGQPRPAPSAAPTDRALATDRESAPGPDSASSVEGKRYLEALVEAIDSAERIVVTEHSSEFDADDEKGRKSLRAEPVVYGTKELSEEQRLAFKTTISKLEPSTQDAFAACIFEPHHTISFFRSNQEPSTMLICFECDQVEWKGSSATPPWSLYGGLRRLVSSVGLEPVRDWRALAREHSKNAP